MKKGVKFLIIFVIVLLVGVMGFSTYVYVTYKDGNNTETTETKEEKEKQEEPQEEQKANVEDVKKKFNSYIYTINIALEDKYYSSGENVSDLSVLELELEDLEIEKYLIIHNELNNLTGKLEDYTCTYNISEAIVCE